MHNVVLGESGHVIAWLRIESSELLPGSAEGPLYQYLSNLFSLHHFTSDALPNDLHRYDAWVVDGKTSDSVIAKLTPRLPVSTPILSVTALAVAGVPESFVRRVFSFGRWHQLLNSGLSWSKLQSFYAQHKYLLMAQDADRYRILGSSLARTESQDLEHTADYVIAELQQALAMPTNRSGYANALQHVRGYWKRDISSEEKSAVDSLIEQYRLGELPLSKPVSAMRQLNTRWPKPYLQNQLLLADVPDFFAKVVSA